MIVGVNKIKANRTAAVIKSHFVHWNGRLVSGGLFDGLLPEGVGWVLEVIADFGDTSVALCGQSWTGPQLLPNRPSGEIEFLRCHHKLLVCFVQKNQVICVGFGFILVIV